MQHGSAAPLALGVAGSAALLAGVVVLRGIASKLGIGAGALLLLGATRWNARLPRACDVPVTLERAARCCGATRGDSDVNACALDCVVHRRRTC